MQESVFLVLFGEKILVDYTNKTSKASLATRKQALVLLFSPASRNAFKGGVFKGGEQICNHRLASCQRELGRSMRGGYEGGFVAIENQPKP